MLPTRLTRGGNELHCDLMISRIQVLVENLCFAFDTYSDVSRV